MTEPHGWQVVCRVDDVKTEDVLGWEHQGRSYAIFRAPGGSVHATDNVCTHEHAHLSDGYVEGTTVECPRHSGRFNYQTGEALGAPVCVSLRTYPVRIEDGQILILV